MGGRWRQSRYVILPDGNGAGGVDVDAPHTGLGLLDNPDLFLCLAGQPGAADVGGGFCEGTAVRRGDGDGLGRVAFADDQGELGQTGRYLNGFCFPGGGNGFIQNDASGLAAGEGGGDVVVDTGQVVGLAGNKEAAGRRGGAHFLPERLPDLGDFRVGVGGLVGQEDDEQRDIGLSQVGAFCL